MRGTLVGQTPQPGESVVSELSCVVDTQLVSESRFSVWNGLPVPHCNGPGESFQPHEADAGQQTEVEGHGGSDLHGGVLRWVRAL